MMKRSSRTHRVLALTFLCLLLLGGGAALALPSAHAATLSHASVPHASVPHISVRPASKLSGGCYLIIDFNYGNSEICVPSKGYNGISFALRHVDLIYVPPCTVSFWMKYYVGGVGYYYNWCAPGDVTILVEWDTVTQVDVTSGAC